MKVILSLLPILIAAAAGYFSFAQTGKFKEVQERHLASLETIKGLSAEMGVIDKNLSDQRKRIADEKGVLESTVANISNFKSANLALKNGLAKVDQELAAQDADFAELDKAMAEVSAVAASIGDVSLDNLAEKIEEIEKSKTDKQARLDELTTLAGAATKALGTAREDADRIALRATERTTRIARNSISARISAVDQEWGFVVIGAGRNSGFTPQTSLIVERDGQRIARVKPSSVEASQTIAEIDLKSLAPGVRLQPGDRVILATPATN